MKTRCSYTHHDGSVYGGLWPHEYLAIIALMEYNDDRQLNDLIYRDSLHPLGIKSDGMRAFIADLRQIKRSPRKKPATAGRDLEIYLFIQDLKDIGDTRPLRSNQSLVDGLATLAAEQFNISEDAAVKAYQRVKKDFHK